MGKIRARKRHYIQFYIQISIQTKWVQLGVTDMKKKSRFLQLKINRSAITGFHYVTDSAAGSFSKNLLLTPPSTVWNPPLSDSHLRKQPGGCNNIYRERL